MKTIKQVADEIGVSKDKVKYRVKSLPDSCREIKGGVTYINLAGIAALSDMFVGEFPGKNTRKLSNSPLSPGDLSTMLEMVNLLGEQLKAKDSQLEAKDRQLDAKDKQIEALNEQLTNTTAVLAASQALHAGTIKGHLTEKPSLWERIIGRKSES